MKKSFSPTFLKTYSTTDAIKVTTEALFLKSNEQLLLKPEHICVLLVRLVLPSNSLNSLSQNSNFKGECLGKPLFQVSQRVTSLRVKVINREDEYGIRLNNDRHLRIILLLLIFHMRQHKVSMSYLLKVIGKSPTLTS